MSGKILSEIRGVLFDFDETLIDAQKGLETTYKAVIEKICNHFNCRKIRLSQEEMIEKFSDFDDEMNLKRNYDRDKWWEKFLNDLGIDEVPTDSQIKELTETYWHTYIESAPPYPATGDILEYLKKEGYLIGVVTDTDGSEVPKRERIARFDFSKLFEVIVIAGEDTEKSKPDSECFKLAAKKLRIKPEKCVMVGDKPFTDIKGAREAGMKTILVKRRNWNSGEEPDYIVRKLTELKELL